MSGDSYSTSFFTFCAFFPLSAYSMSFPPPSFHHSTSVAFPRRPPETLEFLVKGPPTPQILGTFYTDPPPIEAALEHKKYKVQSVIKRHMHLHPARSPLSYTTRLGGRTTRRLLALFFPAILHSPTPLPQFWRYVPKPPFPPCRLPSYVLPFFPFLLTFPLDASRAKASR